MKNGLNGDEGIKLKYIADLTVKEDNTDDNNTVLLEGENEVIGDYVEHFKSTSTKRRRDKRMRGKNKSTEKFEGEIITDKTIRVNSIEDSIKLDVKKVETVDLIYYLKAKTQNKELSDTDYKKTSEYLNSIKGSYAVDNVTNNNMIYSNFALGGVLMLLPYYYNFPRFYQTGFWEILFGMFGVITIISCIENYSKLSDINFLRNGLFKKLGLKWFVFSVLFYAIFFVYICRLNHITLFFVSMVIVYLMMSYVLRLVVLDPSSSNKLINYRGRYVSNVNVTPYNDNIEKACNEINIRYNMGMPNGRVVYDYLSFIKIGKSEKSGQIWDFATYFVQPFMIIGLLYVMGTFFNNYETKIDVEGVIKSIRTIPIVGLNDNSLKYVECQANYVLPDEINYERKIGEILTERCYDQKLQSKLKGVLEKIGIIYLERYQPLFSYVEDDKTKVTMTVSINEAKKDYEEDIWDKKNYLLNEDEDIIHQNKELIKSILDDFCAGYERVFNEYKEGEVIEYKPRLIGSGGESKDWRDDVWRSVIKMIIGLSSVWMTVGKVLGSSWLMSKYAYSYFGGVGVLIESYKRNWMVWRYCTMGIDKTEYENLLRENPELGGEMSTMGIIISILILLFLGVPFMTTMTQMVFGLSYSPKYINLIWIVLLIINMIGNMMISENIKRGEGGIGLTGYNTMYIIVSILIIVVVSITKII